MTLPIPIILLLVALIIFISSFGLWLSLKTFRLKPRGARLFELLGIGTAIFALSSLFSIVVGGSLGFLIDTAVFIAGAFLWDKLLKRSVPDQYSSGRAYGSYFTGAIFAVILAIIAAILSVALFAQVFVVDGDSMAPELKNNQNVLVYKFDKQPDNDSIVIFNNSEGNHYFGRVRGLPGQSVAIKGGQVEIDGNIQEVRSYTLSDDQYFVTFDNAEYNLPPRVISDKSIVGTVGPKLN